MTHGRSHERTLSRRHLRARACLLATVMSLLVVVPAAHATNFAVNQNAEMLLGAPDYTTPAHSTVAAMQNGLGGPYGVAVDSAGSVYTADAANRLIRWGTMPVANGAAMSNVAHQEDESQASFSNGCAQGLSSPYQVAASGDGGTQRLLVADRYNNRVVGFLAEPTTDLTKGTLFLGQTNASSCSADRDPTFPFDPPTAATLDGPRGVWTNGTRIAVADTENNRVLLWDAWPANGDVGAARVLGQADFVSELPNRGGAAAANTLFSPQGVHWDGTYLYVADTQNNRVLVWNGWPGANGAAATWVLGQPDMATTSQNCSATKMFYPVSITTKGAGAAHRIAVTARYNHRVVIYHGFAAAPATNYAATVAVGQTNLTLCSPNQILPVAGANTLRSPGQVQYDLNGDLWVADELNHRLLRYDTAALAASNASADLVLGHAGGTAMTASTPYDVNANSLFGFSVDDNGARVAGGQVAIVPGTGALVASSQFGDNTAIWDTAPAANNVPFTWRIGQNLRTDAGNSGPDESTVSATQHCDPNGTWTDGTRLLVADSCSHRVLAWTTMPTSDTDPPDYVIGQTNFTTDTAGTTQSRLDTPYDVTSDGTDVYVADRSNNRVTVYRDFWTAPVNRPNATAVIGQVDFTSGGAGVSSTRLDAPSGIDLDSAGRLAIADTGNNRIIVYADPDAIAANGVAADAVVGQVNFTTRSTSTRTNYTQDVALAGNALLFTQTTRAYVLDPLPVSGATDGPTLAAASREIGIGSSFGSFAANRLNRPTGIDAANGEVWIQNTGHARLMRWDDDTNPTLVSGPTATVRCDGTVTISWTTSESTSTEIRWDTVSRASWAGGYANQYIDTNMSNPTHSYDLSFATPGTKYVRVRAADWDAGNTPVVSGEISFVVPATCPAPTTMFGDDDDAQGGDARANPSTTNAPPILSTTFRTSWINASGVTMDRREAGTWTTPPEHAGGLWQLDGSTAADPSSQYAAAGAWTGAAGYVAGRFGQGADFSGTRRVTVAHDPLIQKANDFTVDAWFSTASIAGSPFPTIAIKSSGVGCGVGLFCNYSIEFMRASNELCATVVTTANIERNSCRTATGLLDGAWHHAALVVTATNHLQLYVDGLPADAGVAMGAVARTTAAALVIGNVSDGSLPLVGSIDAVRFSPVAYDAAAILGYYRTRRPHAQQLWTSASTALGANCATATRCEDQTYAGVADIMRDGARYWQRTRFNTLTNDYWTDWGNDWVEVEATETISVVVGGSIDLGSRLPGVDAFGTSTIDVACNSPGGYQVLGRDESDTWALQRTPATDDIADRQDGSLAPIVWTAGTPGFFGVTVRDATGGRLAKWGAGTGWPETDVTNNRYTGLENSTDVLLHERTTYSLATDTVVLTSRVNADAGTLSGAYDGTLTITAVANP